jgi:hypothetical protein
MKGDFSRYTFDPAKHYTAVLMQQGRVQLDADWNEQRAIDTHHEVTTLRDIVGDNGAPVDDAGFAMSFDAKGRLLIGAGRYYVQGLLAENGQTVAYDLQPGLPGQPDPVALTVEAGLDACLLYLDVWQRHVTALEDPYLREVALDGPDTTTRVQTVWQVRALPFRFGDEPDPCAAGAKALAADTGWEPAGLAAWTNPTTALDEACELPPSAGYTRLENDLYRVEVHDGGPVGKATLLWARHNATVVTAIVEGTGGREVAVADLGPDDVLGFAPGQYVTVSDDRSELAGGPGRLARITSIDAARRVVTLDTEPGPVDLKHRPKLRRWDSHQQILTQADTKIPLEAGIEVRLTAGTLRTGDYWLIPARVATGDVEWPRDGTPDHRPLAVPPLGIEHRYAPLAIIRPNGMPTDCRRLFRPLATGAHPALHVVGTSWQNDTPLAYDELVRTGLQITLDAAPEPYTVRDNTIVVTVERPDGTGPWAVAHILSGTATVTGRVITWRPNLDTDQTLPPMTYAVAELPPQRLRIVLSGHAIWADGPIRRHLDGTALGEPVDDGKRIRTGLAFPSGTGGHSSDFTSWCFLTGQ